MHNYTDVLLTYRHSIDKNSKLYQVSLKGTKTYLPIHAILWTLTE